MAIPIDLSMNLGNLIVTAVSGCILWALRKIFNLLKHQLDRLDKHEHVLDLHTGLLSRFGWKPDDDVWFDQGAAQQFRMRMSDRDTHAASHRRDRDRSPSS